MDIAFLRRGNRHTPDEASPGVSRIQAIKTLLDDMVRLAPDVRSPQRRVGPYIAEPVRGPIVAMPEERLMRVPGRVVEYTPTVKFRIAPKVIQEIVRPEIVRGPPERVIRRVRRTPKEEQYDGRLEFATGLLTDTAVDLIEKLIHCARVEQGVTGPAPTLPTGGPTALSALVD